jgi:hypothetical protein
LHIVVNLKIEASGAGDATVWATMAMRRDVVAGLVEPRRMVSE